MKNSIETFEIQSSDDPHILTLFLWEFIL